MLHFEDWQLKEIYKLGASKYEIPIKKSGRYYDSDLSGLLHKYPQDFDKVLKHQMNDNPLNISLFLIVYRKCSYQNWYSDLDLQKKVKEWVMQNIPIEKSRFDLCVDSFFKKKKKDLNIEEFEKVFKYYEPEEQREMLELSIALCKESSILHRLKCDSTDCAFETTNNQEIAYLKHTLKSITPSDQPHSNLTKIQWNGSQKQLAELFIELKKNGWIQGFENATIKACFTNSKTIHQALKPTQDSKSFESTYDGVFTTNYTPLFYGIQENPKAKG